MEKRRDKERHTIVKNTMSKVQNECRQFKLNENNWKILAKAYKVETKITIMKN